METVRACTIYYTGQWLRPDDSHHLIRCPGWSWPLPLSLPVLIKTTVNVLTGLWNENHWWPLSASKNSLPFLLCAQFIGILKAIKYDNSAISSRLNFPIIALNQSYVFLLGLFFFPHGVHIDSDALAHITAVMREPWSPLKWQTDPN